MMQIIRDVGLSNIALAVLIDNGEVNVLVNKMLSIEELGNAYADLTELLIDKYPEALHSATHRMSMEADRIIKELS